MIKYILKSNIYIFVLFSFGLMLFPNIAKSADRPLQIDIMGGNIQAMPIAISYFSSDEDLKYLNFKNH